MAGTCSLIFETSTPHASLALVTPDGGLEIREFTSDRSHNAVLFTPLQQLLACTEGLQTGLVLVGAGPGSYSGTRVGIAAAQGVALAAGCPAVALPSILAVPAAANGQACLAIGDARRGSFWTAEVEHSRLLVAPGLTDAAGLLEVIQTYLTAGRAIFSFEDPARFPLPAAVAAHVKLEFPSASLLWQVWLAADKTCRDEWISQIPQPMYLKPPHITPSKFNWPTS